jgi:ComF family protein
LTWRIDRVHAPFVYAPPLDHYLHALKYRRSRALGRALALELAPQLRAAARELDGLVAVPLHRSRRIERGYNQAHEIARTLAHALHVPLLSRGIVRLRAGTAQTRQGAAERRAAVADAFRVMRNLDGQRLAIVDDIVTTGATINALARELRAAGAATCIAFAVARTPECVAQSRAEGEVEHDAGKDGTAEPGVVQERSE